MVAALILLISPAVVVPAAADSLERPDGVDRVGFETSMVLDSAGNPVIAYTDITNGDIKLLHCDDPNCSPGGDSITSPFPPGASRRFPVVTLDAAGNPVIAAKHANEVELVHCDDPNCSPGGDTTNSVLTGDAGSQIALAIDSSGNPVLAVGASAVVRDLYVIHCDDPNCAPGGDSKTTPDPNGVTFNIHQAAMVLDAVGNPVIAYGDLTNDDLRLLHCDDPNCTGVESPTTVDSAGNVGTSPSIQLDGSGNPVVAYRSSTSGLKILHCDDPNCVAGGESIVSPVFPTSGFGTSLQLDGSGHPVVAFRALDNGRSILAVLHCDDPNCTGTELVSYPGPSGSHGVSPSLQLDSDGFPVVSFQDIDQEDVMVLHCDDPRCRPQRTIYVDGSAVAGAQDGTAWADAYLTVQDGLAEAYSGDTVLVAQGTYLPHVSDRDVSFEIRSNVTVQGGYASGGGAGPDNELYETVLSGDLDGDDTATVATTEPSRSDNSYQVVDASGTTGVALSHLTIADGNANVTVPAIPVAGLNLEGADARIDHVTVRDNSGVRVGGVAISGTTDTVVSNSRITNNATGFLTSGGGLRLTGGADAAVINTIVDGNRAVATGGGIFISQSSPTFVNTLVVDNEAGGTGGGVQISGGSSDPLFVNPTVAGNQAGASSVGGAFRTTAGATVTIANGIVWANKAGTERSLSGSGYTVLHSDVEGGAPGAGNIDLDPNFVDPANGDYRFLGPVGSPVLDAGSNASVPADVYDVDASGTVTEPTPDLNLDPRIAGGTVDMGAYEGAFQPPTCGGEAITVDIGAGDSPTPGDDVILGTPGDDIIFGGAGNDKICGGDGDDLLVGQDGDDTIFGGDGNDSASGNAGDDVLVGENGSDRLFGGSGRDVVFGGPGGDAALGGGSGVDTVEGGLGDDVLSGGSDADTSVDGGAGDDAVNGGGGDDQVVRGGDGNDTVSGNGGDDVINGDGGDDEVRGGLGDDMVFGDGGDDFVAGNGGVDVCDGGTQIVADSAAANCETVLNVP